MSSVTPSDDSQSPSSEPSVSEALQSSETGPVNTVDTNNESAGGPPSLSVDQDNEKEISVPVKKDKNEKEPLVEEPKPPSVTLQAPRPKSNNPSLSLEEKAIKEAIEQKIEQENQVALAVTTVLKVRPKPQPKNDEEGEEKEQKKQDNKPKKDEPGESSQLSWKQLLQKMGEIGATIAQRSTKNSYEMAKRLYNKFSGGGDSGTSAVSKNDNDLGPDNTSQPASSEPSSAQSLEAENDPQNVSTKLKTLTSKLEEGQKNQAEYSITPTMKREELIMAPTMMKPSPASSKNDLDDDDDPTASPYENENIAESNKKYSQEQEQGSEMDVEDPESSPDEKNSKKRKSPFDIPKPRPPGAEDLD